MPINRLLEGAAFDPAAVKVITAAFDDTLRELDLERTDPMAELVARKIIEGAHVGERDPARLRALVVAAYRIYWPQLTDLGAVMTVACPAPAAILARHARAG